MPAQTLDGRAVPPVSGGASAGTSLNPTAVMGVYNDENALITCFRVAEDSTYSDAQDELFTLPAGNIGIPHVLEIPLNPPLHSGKFTLITNCFPLSNSSNVVVTTLLITNVMSMNCHAGTDVSAGPDALSGLNAEAGNVWKKAAASMRCANLPLMVLSNLKQNLFH